MSSRSIIFFWLLATAAPAAPPMPSVPDVKAEFYQQRVEMAEGQTNAVQVQTYYIPGYGEEYDVPSPDLTVCEAWFSNRLSAGPYLQFGTAIYEGTSGAYWTGTAGASTNGAVVGYEFGSFAPEIGCTNRIVRLSVGGVLALSFTNPPGSLGLYRGRSNQDGTISLVPFNRLGSALVVPGATNAQPTIVIQTQ